MLKGGEGKNAGGELRGEKPDIRGATNQGMDEKGVEGEEVKR